MRVQKLEDYKGLEMEKKTCTYPGCQATSIHKGTKGPWEFYLCKKHKEYMLPLLGKGELKAQKAVRGSDG